MSHEQVHPVFRPLLDTIASKPAPTIEPPRDPVGALLDGIFGGACDCEKCRAGQNGNGDV